MRKTFILLVFLAGCAGTAIAPPTKNRNENCFDSFKMKVFQVGDTSILARLCPIDSPRYYQDPWDYCDLKGDLVYMEVPINNDYVDDQKISLPEKKCFISDGTYSYKTRDGFDKTVRKIKIIDSQVPNSAIVDDRKTSRLSPGS